MDGKNSRPTHRDKAAMNGAQTSLFAKPKRKVGSVSGPPAWMIIGPDNNLEETLAACLLQVGDEHESPLLPGSNGR